MEQEDTDKAKEQLIGELVEARQRVAELEASQAELKLAEEQLKAAHEELRQAYGSMVQAQRLAVTAEKLAAVGRLTAGTCHEILNPLNTILLTIHMMLRDDRTPPEMVEDLVILKEQAYRINKITDGLVYFARQRTPNREPLDFNEKVRGVLNLKEHLLRMQNIAVELKLAEGLPPVSADMDQLQQVVLNLVTNARDSMPNGGKLTLSTDSVQMNGQRFVELQIEDTGRGIASEHMDKLFEPFFTTKPEGEGTGLGLAICQGIVEAHGGSIRAESEEGQGTTFVIQLPLEPTREIEPA